MGEIESHFDINDVLQKVTNSINTLTGSGFCDTKGGFENCADGGTGSLVEESAQENQKVTNSSSDLYVFPEEKYPYRAMLTAEQKSVYDQIYANAAKVISTFKVTGSISERPAGKQFMTALYDDHPELLWLDTSYVSVIQAKIRRVRSPEINSTAIHISQ